jgi:hypothetical protein
VRFQDDQVRPWIPPRETFLAHIRSLLSPENLQTNSQA